MHSLSLSHCPSLCLTASVLYRVRLNGQVSAWPTRTTTCHHRLAGLTRSWSAIASSPTTTGGASSPTTRTSSSGQPHLTPRSSCLPRPRRCRPVPRTHWLTVSRRSVSPSFLVLPHQLGVALLGWTTRSRREAGVRSRCVILCNRQSREGAARRMTACGCMQGSRRPATGSASSDNSGSKNSSSWLWWKRPTGLRVIIILPVEALGPEGFQPLLTWLAVGQTNLRQHSHTVTTTTTMRIEAVRSGTENIKTVNSSISNSPQRTATAGTPPAMTQVRCPTMSATPSLRGLSRCQRITLTAAPITTKQLWPITGRRPCWVIRPP